MLELNSFSIDGKPFSDEARAFVNDALLRTMNRLQRQGVRTKFSDLLGTQDIYLVRGPRFSLLVLSHDRVLAYPRYAELNPSDVALIEDLDLEGPVLVSDPQMQKNCEVVLKAVRPVAVAFPTSYLTLAGDERNSACERMAETLAPIVESDVDQKLRIVRMNPVFSRRGFTLDPQLCFVLMEFKPPYTDIYRTAIEPTVKGEGMVCRRSDDIFSTDPVIEDIWENINRAALIIAEITPLNPNVMYELGICHTIGKNVMMITQDTSKLPFNFRHMRVYPYANDIAGAEELKKNIRSVIGQQRESGIASLVTAVNAQPAE